MTYVMAQTESLERIEALEDALRAIANIGGNLSDDALMEPTGPNDAAARGIMYVSARELANIALSRN